jgi:hypothetical protein
VANAAHRWTVEATHPDLIGQSAYGSLVFLGDLDDIAPDDPERCGGFGSSWSLAEMLRRMAALRAANYCDVDSEGSDAA